MLDPDEFDQTTLATQRVEQAQLDPMYVDNNISNSDLGQEQPFPFTLIYTDGKRLEIPLTNVFFEPITEAKVTILRKHSATGRIVPFQASQNDPRLRDPALRDLPAGDVMDRVVPPRFDTTLTPNIVDMVLQAQSIFLARGILNIIALRMTSPPLRAGAAVAGNAAASVIARNAAQRVLTREGTITVEAAVARNLVKPTGKLVQILRAIQPRFVVSPPQSLLEAYKIVSEAARSVGLESGIVREGTFLSEKLVIENVGNITTTILKTGEIIVRNGNVVILRLMP